MNLKNLTYRQKNRYLLIGAGVFFVLAYVTTISKTVGLYFDNNTLEKKVASAETAPQQVGILKGSLHSLNDKLSFYLTDTLKNHENTLEVVSEFCNRRRLVVRELPHKIVSEEKNFTIETSVLRVEGSFTDLLKLVHELERKHRLGRLSSVSFQTVKDNQRKRTVLVLTIYLQNIRINNSLNQQGNENV